MSLTEIMEGWRNHLVPPEELRDIIETVTKGRTKICETCEFHSKFHKTLRPDAHCTECGCTLAAKQACLSCYCPKGKWGSIDVKEKP